MFEPIDGEHQELFGPAEAAEQPPSLPPVGLGQDILVELARPDRISDPAVKQACKERLPDPRLVGNEEDEAYLIRPSNAIREGKVTPLIRRISVRDPQTYHGNLVRVFRKIYVHQQFNTLIGWFKIDTAEDKAYYIVISYEGDVLPVSPGDAHDSEVPLGRLRQDYAQQCRVNHDISV